MCLLFVAWQHNREFPLVVAANRDEFHQRPTAPLQWWDEAPHLAAGRDLQAGGTWLGVTRHGRFAALTNVRDPQAGARPRSRGLLVRDVLLGEQPLPELLDQLTASLDEYAPFNLLASDRHQLFYLNNLEQRQPRPLAAGIHSLSNARLDTPWPKVRRGRTVFSRLLEQDADMEALLDMLRDSHPARDDELPDTGVGLTYERALSSIFIPGAEYGTRCSTVLRVGDDGHTRLCERRYDEHSEIMGTSCLDFRHPVITAHEG